uniref:Vacuolar protein sorting 13 homolog A n=1 Tax=Piliocolobus tephrosceles TaxID=591936 RepID=A0A8C9J8R2_9PRIM
MVFESVVVDVLNRFLGDYVVDLDTSQLSLGIWQGAVALKNLHIKENALSQLDVPFKVKVGHIGNLKLIIPWKNLYTQPVEAVLEEIYLLIVPSSRIKYDPLKEEKQLMEAKQQELKRIEEAKQKVVDQEQHLPEKQDTFAEKLVTQIIKNLQVKISSIHIRYEDDITNRDKPLSFGISLQNLSMQTTDQYWVPCLHDETEKLVRKLIRLDNLFAYWNVKSQMFYLNDYDDSLDDLRNGIVNENIVPEGYDFVFRPISANAKLVMNRRSDFDFSAPKINLDVELHNIAIEFNKPQYFSIMELLESVDMMTQNMPYRKFRPDVPLHHHAREWWAYAIHGVLEVNVCPRLRMWSWKHIRKHRGKMKQYKELYKKKLTSKKLPGELLVSLEELEKTLDVLNITIARQQAEVEVKKAGYKIYKEGVKDPEDNKGWFSWLWSWSEQNTNEQQPDVKPGILEEMLTPEEKALLYEAIGYSETAVDPTLPKTFEALKFFVHLKSMSVVLRENHQKPELIDIVIEEFSTLIVQRPGAQAVKFETKIDSFHITGLPENSEKPRLLSSLDDAMSLFQITFEINPLDETVAQRCIIEAEPLEIIYDARTVNSIVEFFRPPKEVHLAQLTSATLTKLEEFRNKTATIQTSTSLGTSQISQRIIPLLELPSVSEDDSEEEFFDAPCSPLEEPLQLPTGVKSIRTRKLQKQDCSVNMTTFKIRFEVPKVLIEFYHLVGDCELSVVEIHVLGLGTEIEIRTYDLKANAFLKEFCLKCPEYLDENRKPVYLITTLDNTMEDLLTLEYVKAERNVPNLKSTYNNVLQLIKVNFSSLDIHLHTEALLNTINYLHNILPQSEENSAPVSTTETEDKGDVIKKLGLDSEMIMRPSETEINAKLRNIIVLDSDITAVYKKAVYITGKEVFSFKMVSYMDATAGSAYTDMNVFDIQVNLVVGCIEVVFVTKFLYSILAFIDNFQAAKQALAEATVQAAGMAATGVKELAQRSSRMALDINIKAPVVVIPQSPVSENVFVADFGLITMTNTFHMITESQSSPPPVIDLITIKLSEMRLYRSQFINDAYQEVLDLLLPLNLEVVVERNLCWEWYQEVPCFNVNAQLKPMEFILSQEDITTIFKTLHGNIWYEKDGSALPAVTKDQYIATSGVTTNASHHSGGVTVVTAAVVEVHSRASLVKTTLNMSFKTDYLTMVLYSPGPKQASFTDVRDPSLKLAEFKLENIISTLKMYTDDSTFSSFSLKNCILDDKRPHVKKATPRMIGLTVGFDKKDMMDIKYRKVRDGCVTDAVFQEMYICASVEFLQTVANVFLEAYTTGTAVETSVQTWTAKEEVPTQESEKWEINVIIKNPEIVFVADMTKNDAPALVITTQCEICYKGNLENSTMTAAIKDLQVRACPFLPVKRKGKVTTVLQPCDLFYQTTQTGTDPQVIDMSVKSLTLKVSPVIINTMITITSALYTTKETIPEETASSTAHLWEKKDTKTLKMWFLEESNETEKIAPTTELVPKGEMIKMNIDSIFIVLEAGIGHRTVPMLLAKSRFSGEGKNWSSLINLHCQLELEVHYYNEMFGVWEPLLEPLEIDQTEDFRPWNLGIKMKKKAKKAIVESDPEEENYKVPEYKTVISFHSKDQLNITLSKCGLVMLNNLGKAFTEAATGSSADFVKDLAPFIILNSLGLTISVSPSDSFSVLSIPMAKSYVLKNEESLSMDYVRTKDNDHFNAMTSLSSKLFFILLTPVNHSTADKIPLTKVGRRLYSVRHRESGVERSIVCQIDTVEGSKKVTIRSPVQIRNHFSVPLSVYEGDTLLGTASPENEFNIPLGSYRSFLFLKPEDEDYQMCEGIDFEEIVKNDGALLKKKCRSKNPSKQSFLINIVPEKDNLTSLSVYSEDGWDLPYIIHLWPPILLRNLLPYKIAYYIQGIENSVFTLNEGHSDQICTVQLDKARLHLKLLDYLNHNWTSEYHVKPNQQDISFVNFTCVTEMEKTDLDIAVHMTYNTGQTVVAFHSPYWMVNKTGRMLQYKADGIHRKHPPNYKKPVLFSFQPNHFFNNNKVQLMVTDSELSDQFSIDTVGSHGAVKCKGLKMDYQVGVTIDLSSFNITRIVTFTPFYMIKNKSKYRLSVAEEGTDKWLSLDLEQCIPFWPEDASSKLLIQVEGSEDPPKRIYFNKQENCILLRLDNELGGIIAEVNLAEHSTVITFLDYHDGAATFLLINHTKNELVQYNQSSLSEIEDSLPPGKAVFYTWADPVGSRRLKWRCRKSHGEVTQKDDMMMPIDLGKKTIYLVSFFEGLQRIILFTEDPKVFKVTYESEKAELAEQEIAVALQDVGISLVNNYTKQEVAYIGITSSDVVWETKPKKKARWKPMSVKHTEKLEREFKEYTESSPSEDKVIELDTNIPVRLTPTGHNMKILQPRVIALRRNYLPALKVEYNTSAHQSSFRIQIYRIQIQNQIHGAVFPFVFYPVKPPKSVTMDSAPKPFTDVSIVMRSAGHSQISRIKYFKVLIQEMDLRLDLGFIYALTDLMTEAEVTENTEVELFHKDIEAFKEEYKTASLIDQSKVSLYEYFHISPLKLHLSVSLSSGGEEAKDSKQNGGLIPVHSLNLLLKSIGATLTDVQDVVFKLAFFELNYQFHTTSDLQSEVIRHYSKQAIKQMYVLILGLDVLGNPFGLIREFSEGVEAFFYEPYQGAIQGPEEFVEGMALGLKALVGGAVGGLAGAASKITGAMAKGVAAMTMDEDYQQKRREAMNKQPAGFREGITRGGKGLVSGFVSGITGIVTKPIKGAQKEGAAGFFKGVGKGLVGAVARPTGGIIDMASSTFQGIKRATETSEVESLRPPRFFNEDGVIRPYRLRDGTGNQMLQVMENGRFAKYKYFTHVMINKTDMLMITRCGVLFVTKGTFGQLTCEWQYSFDEFTKEPFIVHERRLRIEAKERVKSVFHAREFGKIINFKTPEDARWILTKLEEAREPSPSL